jgi:hypothetical protein
VHPTASYSSRFLRAISNRIIFGGPADRALRSLKDEASDDHQEMHMVERGR